MEADTTEIQQKQDFNSNETKMLVPGNMRSIEELGVIQESASDGMIYDFIGFVLFAYYFFYFYLTIYLIKNKG